jgi:hypothetical protein
MSDVKSMIEIIELQRTIGQSYSVMPVTNLYKIVGRIKDLEEALLDIKHALGANPNESSVALFDKCANAFKIAEDAQNKESKQ